MYICIRSSRSLIIHNFHGVQVTALDSERANDIIGVFIYDPECFASRRLREDEEAALRTEVWNYARSKIEFDTVSATGRVLTKHGYSLQSRIRRECGSIRLELGFDTLPLLDWLFAVADEMEKVEPGIFHEKAGSITLPVSQPAAG